MPPRFDSSASAERTFLDTLRPCPTPLPSVAWLLALRERPTMRAERIPLADVMRSRHGDATVTGERLGESIVGVHSVLRGREVRSWHQPLLTCARDLRCGMLVRETAHGQEWLVQAVEEPSLVGGAQLGPTLQVDAPGSNPAHVRGPYDRYFDDAGVGERILDVVQSEEGGRFFRDGRRYLAVQVAEGAELEPSDPHRWVPVGELKRAVALENVVNVFARTFIAILL